jgi:putative transposase
MPWRDSSPMDLKTQFIADYLRQMLSISELCLQYNISRKTAYKWIDRFLDQGATGLEDRSRRPHLCPYQTPTNLVEAILDARRHHPTWGAKKLLKILSRREPHIEWPSRSTVCSILSRHGLVKKPRRRRLIGHPGKPTSIITTPNQVWSADFKGHFKTRDGHYCYPLTVTDNFSRYLLGCQALRSTSCDDARPVFRRLFQEFGLPQRIRTDNGVPFATVSLARLSTLSAWFIRLGIMPELIEPGKPQQNGRHERMHRTMKAEATRPPAANCRTQQRTFNRFRREFNFERPHEAIALETPAARYQPSPRPYPTKLPPLEYPAHFETRYVSHNGGIRWNCAWVNVSITCAGEYVGLEEIDNGIWNLYFGPLRLGRLMEEQMRIEDAYGSLWRHQRKQNNV